MATNSLTQTAYADHLRGAADLAIEIADRINLHGDDARQACFATVLINAERHNLFMEPLPRDTNTSVTEQPKLEGVVTEQASGKPTGGYEALVSPENQGALRNPSAEEAEEAAKKVLKAGIKRACRLLNDEGWKPILTPDTIDAYITKETDIGKTFVALDLDDMETLIKNLSFNLDELKAKKKKTVASKTEEAAGF